MKQILLTDKRNISDTLWGILRITLGALLIWKAIHFIRDTFILEYLTSQHSQAQFTRNEALLMLGFASLVLIGGLFILMGFFTPFTAMIVLPVFSIGILFIHAEYVERNGFELFVTAIIPFLLLMFISKSNHQIVNH